jgi:hypothetical protein
MIKMKTLHLSWERIGRSINNDFNNLKRVESVVERLQGIGIRY